MRVLALLLLAIATTSVFAVRPSFERMQQLASGESEELLFKFVQFAAQYNRTYPNEGEVLFRLKVFKEFLAMADGFNIRAKKLGSTATYGITMFADLTKEEFKNNYLMKMPAIPANKQPFNHHTLTEVDLPGNAMPPTFDWRNYGKVTPVYNQGSCGSCWAFSATENHESRFAIQHGTSPPELSVQQIIDCDDSSEYGCNGGWPYQAWEYLQQQGGQDSLQCYPYLGYDSSCRWNPSCNAAHVTGWQYIAPHNEPAMAGWLAGNAPLSICVDASQWSSYNGGVVLGSECATALDHCVLATGYNLNHNPPYWIVRNSWGPGWGSGGYIALQYNTNTCGMADYPGSCNT